MLSHWCVYWLLLVGLPFICCHTYTLHSVLYQHWSLQEAHNLWQIIWHVNTSWKKMWGKTKEGRLVPPFYKIRTIDVFTLKALMKTTESPPSWRRKKKSTQHRSQFLTWLVHLNSKDSLSTWVYVVKKWHPEHTCLLVLYTHLCIFVNCWGQDGWQVNISTLFSVMTTDSIWPSVFGWSPKRTGKGSKPTRAVLCSP